LCACRRSLLCLLCQMASVKTYNHRQHPVEVVPPLLAASTSWCILNLLTTVVVTLVPFRCFCREQTVAMCHCGLKTRIYMSGQNITRNCSNWFIITVTSGNIMYTDFIQNIISVQYWYCLQGHSQDLLLGRKGRGKLFNQNFPFLPLPFISLSPSYPFIFFPFHLPFHSAFLPLSDPFPVLPSHSFFSSKSSCGIWDSARNSPSWVCDRAPVADAFWRIYCSQNASRGITC